MNTTQSAKYQIEQTEDGYIVRILEKHWSGADSFTLPQTSLTAEQAESYAEGWLAL